MSQKNVADLVSSSYWEAKTLTAATSPIEGPQPDFLQPDGIDERLENSIVQQNRLEEISRKIEVLFRGAEGRHFEDGMESEFSNELLSLVEKSSEDAIKVIAQLASSEMVSDEVVSEALRWLGRMDHRPTYHARLWLLERSLFSPSAKIRDGAALGLAAMDDPHATTYLKQAIQKEKHHQLREDLNQVLAQLEASESLDEYELPGITYRA